MPLIIPSNSISAVGYEVDNSLRFDDGSSDSLTRTQGTPTNADICTFSVWFKLGADVTSNDISIFQEYVDVFNFFGISKKDNGRSQVFQFDGGSFNINVQPSRLFRDHSAWYHVVVAYDSSQSTASDRVKIYVNGVQETSFSASTYPAQNLDNRFNSSGKSIKIGTQNSNQYWDGYMAETVFIDGTALDPTSFGEFDEDTGIWKPIDVSGLSFGTNGFYLPFENSGALGQDDSGNGNNFTVNNLTSIDQTTDTPTNNFATLNPLGTVQLGTLSEGNLKLVSSSAYKIATSTIAVSSGKWYVENKITGGSPDAMLGVIDVQDYQTNSSINYAGDKTNSVGYYKDGRKFIANSASSYGASYTTDDIIGIALDLDSGTKTITFYKNGASQGAINLPTAGSEEWYFLPSPYNATIEVNFGNPPFTISSGNSDANGYGNFEYAVPSGYYALNTKNLAEFG